jgi:hypothetical protein
MRDTLAKFFWGIIEGIQACKKYRMERYYGTRK